MATLIVRPNAQLDIDEARLRQYWLLAERAPDQEAVSVLLQSGSGRPLVVENFVGEGRVLVQTFPLGLEWSNVPLLKAYVVMIHDWLGFLTAPTTSRYNLEPVPDSEALRVTSTEEVYDVDATLDGGGISGQAGALRLGIARALCELDPEMRATLKRAGLLTRDPREKESKKAGLKKARKAPQYSKR